MTAVSSINALVRAARACAAEADRAQQLGQYRYAAELRQSALAALADLHAIRPRAPVHPETAKGQEKARVRRCPDDGIALIFCIVPWKLTNGHRQYRSRARRQLQRRRRCLFALMRAWERRARRWQGSSSLTYEVTVESLAIGSGGPLMIRAFGPMTFCNSFAAVASGGKSRN